MSARGVGRGKFAEGVIDRVFHAAARAGKVADLRRMSVETIVADGEIIRTRKSGCNFIGWMLDGTGRFVAEEVISTTTARPDYLYLADVLSHKAGFLSRCHEAGGVAVLSVVDTHGQAFAFSWKEVRDLERISLIGRAPTEPTAYLKDRVVAGTETKAGGAA